MEMRLKNIRPKPKPGDGECVKVISLLKNNLLKRLVALVTEEYLIVDVRVFPLLGAETRKHAI